MNWSDISAAPLSEAAIRALPGTQPDAKIYANTYAAGQSFNIKAGHPFSLYVQSGSCKTSVDGGELTLNGGEFIALDKATYAFDVVGDHQLTLLKVFSAA